MFVLSLKRGMYLYQFGQYAWTHMILLIIFVPSSFFVSNIFEGLIWFLLPSALIITNDIMAYLAGTPAAALLAGLTLQRCGFDVQHTGITCWTSCSAFCCNSELQRPVHGGATAV